MESLFNSLLSHISSLSLFLSRPWKLSPFFIRPSLPTERNENVFASFLLTWKQKNWRRPSCETTWYKKLSRNINLIHYSVLIVWYMTWFTDSGPITITHQNQKMNFLYPILFTYTSKLSQTAVLWLSIRQIYFRAVGPVFKYRYRLNIFFYIGIVRTKEYCNCELALKILHQDDGTSVVRLDSFRWSVPILPSQCWQFCLRHARLSHLRIRNNVKKGIGGRL